MGATSKARLANGIVSAAIVAFFLVHGALGALALATGYTSPLAWLVWLGVALAGVHVVLSIVTSREQLTDVEHPPSPRKKRHLALKWATGGALALLAAAHVVTIELYDADAVRASGFGALLIVTLAAALATHLSVGAKSLLKDVGVNRRYKGVFRAVVIALAVVYGVAAFVGMSR